MTKWLDAMAADPAPLTPAKVVKHKPADAIDAYWTPDGKRVNEKASWDPSTSWNKTYPVHLEPRLVAGAPVANDVMKCQLKPVDFSRLQGEVHLGPAVAHEEGLQGRRLRLVEAQRRLFVDQGHVPALLIMTFH